jgi:hypothetical protein
VVTHIAGEGARNVGGVGQLLGYLKMKIQKADGSGDISEKGYGKNPYRTYNLNVSGRGAPSVYMPRPEILQSFCLTGSKPLAAHQYILQ